MNDERRRYERMDYPEEIIYTMLLEKNDTPSESGVGDAVNLSEAGVCFTTDTSLDADQLLYLYFRVPTISFPLLTLGKTIWCREQTDAGGYQIGAKLIGLLHPKIKGILRRFNQFPVERKSLAEPGRKGHLDYDYTDN